MSKNINELCETFIYLCDQHGILIQSTSITDKSFNFKPNIVASNLASAGLNDSELIAKCNELANSIGLQSIGTKCQLKEIKIISKSEESK